MTDRYDPILLDQFFDQLNPAVNFRSKRGHMYAPFKHGQATAFCQLPTAYLKELRSQGSAHFLVRKNALVMHAHGLSNGLAGLYLHQTVDLTDHAAIVLVRTRNQCRQPRCDTIFRQKCRYFDITLRIGSVYIYADSTVIMDIDKSRVEG